MCSMALRWLARRLLNSFRSPMMWSIARRCSSRLRRRRSSVSTCSRSWLAAAAGSGTAGGPSSVTMSEVVTRPSPLSASRLLAQALELLLEGDHLRLAAHAHFLDFLQIQNLLLQLALGFFQIAHHLFVRAHVAQDADGPDHLAVGVAQGRGVEGGGDDLAAGAPRIEAGRAGDAALDHLAEGGGELPGFLGADEARERLLEHFVLAEAKELVVFLIIREAPGFTLLPYTPLLRSALEFFQIAPRLFVRAHVAQDADRPDHLA